MIREEYEKDTYKMEIFERVPQKSKVLEVGCNFGRLGEALIKEKDCIVYGVDFYEPSIEIAKDKLTVAKLFDLEKYTLPFKDKFDVIIFEDILEHLRYPEKILIKYRKMLNPTGKILISIPNVANIINRFKLLFGRWDYQNSGILDRTHFKFYTRKTSFNLLRGAGYRNNKRVGFTPGFSFIFFRYYSPLKKIRNFLCSLNTNLFAKQFLLEGRLR